MLYYISSKHLNNIQIKNKNLTESPTKEEDKKTQTRPEIHLHGDGTQRKGGICDTDTVKLLQHSGHGPDWKVCKLRG